MIKLVDYLLFIFNKDIIMSVKIRTHSFFKFLFTLSICIASQLSVANSNEVARLSQKQNAVSFSPVGVDQWVKAEINRTLITGDGLWADEKSRAELQLKMASVRSGAMTYLKILNLNNKIAQFQLTQGTLAVSVHAFKSKYQYEVDTPNVALTMNQTGYFRVDVINNATFVTVREGEVTVYGKNLTLKVPSGLICQFTGVTLENYICSKLGPMDDFAQWSIARDKHLKSLKSKDYVSTTVIGYADLEQYGQWKSVKKYGYIWLPDNIESDWAPYRNGHWVWVRHWGWTWVDDASWGFAPFHYGRWLYIEERWAWVPGPAEVDAVYAPALVLFLGNKDFHVTSNTTGFAWAPLGPEDIYIPSFPTTENYFTQVNITNTTLNKIYIDKVYNKQITQIQYQNLGVKNAITAVPTDTFVQSKQVEQETVKISSETLEQVNTSSKAEITPDTTSVLGSAEITGEIPNAEIIDQPIISKTQPATSVPFEEESSLLKKNPGIPLTEQETQDLEKNAAIQDPRVELIDSKITPRSVKNISDKPLSTQEITSETQAPQQEAQPRIPKPKAQQPRIPKPKIPQSKNPNEKEQ